MSNEEIKLLKQLLLQTGKTVSEDNDSICIKDDATKEMLVIEKVNLNKDATLLIPGGTVGEYEDALKTLATVNMDLLSDKVGSGVTEAIKRCFMMTKLLLSSLYSTTKELKEEISSNTLIDILAVPVKTEIFTDEYLKCDCPVCGNRLKLTPYGCICEKFEHDTDNGCFFAIGEIAGVILSKEEMEELITTGSLHEKDNFLSRTKHPFKAGLALNFITNGNGEKIGKNISFTFPKRDVTEVTDIKCVICKHPMLRTRYSYKCDCGYQISHLIAGVEVSDEDIKQLLETGKSGYIKGFKNKRGKTFNAYLKLDEKGDISFTYRKKYKRKDT